MKNIPPSSLPKFNAMDNKDPDVLICKFDVLYRSCGENTNTTTRTRIAWKKYLE
jgi:hypothetical protein